MRGARIRDALLLLTAVALVAWIRLLPLGLPSVPALAEARVRGQIAARHALPNTAALDGWIAAHRQRFADEVATETARVTARLQYEDAAGRRWPLLGDFDSYAWLRGARNILRHGSECDARVAGACRDALTLAPVGLPMLYAGSPHTLAIVAVHRLATAIDADFPLAASAYLVPVLLGVLGVLPAFAIGRRLAGPWGGAGAALVCSLHPVLLGRSLGADNDAWNAVLPLYMTWAALSGLLARGRPAQVAGGLAAGAVAGLHAAVWRGWTFGFAALLAGLAAAMALHALRWLARHGDWRVWRAREAQAAALVGVACVAAAAVATAAAGADPHAIGWLRDLVGLAAAPAAAAEEWPSALALVSELAVPTLGAIAAQSYGAMLFLAGWLGMLLALLPRHDWRVGHFAVLIGATLLYRYLLGAAGLDRAVLVGLLALPLLAAVAVQVRDGDAADATAAGAGLLVAVWLLAALLLAYEATRFILLLAAPFGLACGVALGRVADWVEGEARDWLGAGRLPVALGALAALLLLALPLRIGHARAVHYLPLLDRGWVDALEPLRATSPPETIVTAWWDYGYWIKYVAERPVSADGGTLRTPAPHWIARVQLAPSEREALGLLRMLDCGSDARPYREGAFGAVARLRRHGLDAQGAYDAIEALSVQDRAAADTLLASRGLDAAARAEVLAATHCAPPPAVLAAQREQIGFGGWWRSAAWRPARPADTAPDGLTTRDWVACTASDGGHRCAVGGADGRGARVEAVTWHGADARTVRLIVARDGVVSEVAPALLLLATPGGVETVTSAGPGPAVLLDPDRERALVGTPAAIASLYVRLMYLDGRGLTHFRKRDERQGAWGQRVTLWDVVWPASGT